MENKTITYKEHEISLTENMRFEVYLEGIGRKTYSSLQSAKQAIVKAVAKSEAGKLKEPVKLALIVSDYRKPTTVEEVEVTEVRTEKGRRGRKYTTVVMKGGDEETLSEWGDNTEFMLPKNKEAYLKLNTKLKETAKAREALEAIESKLEDQMNALCIKRLPLLEMLGVVEA